MKFAPRVQEIINIFSARYDYLRKSTNDDDRRSLTQKIAEQVAYELGPRWGQKRADPGRPLSKDTLAFNGDDQLHGWDLFNGTTREANQFPDEINPVEMKEQVFVLVTPTNHLGAPSAPSAPPAPPVPQAPAPQTCQFTPCDCGPDLVAIFAELERLKAEVASQTGALAALIAKPTPPIPTRAEGRLFGARIVLDLK